MPQVFAGQRVTAALLSLNYALADIGAVTVTAASLTDLTASFTVPAGDAAAGNIYEVEAWGNGTWGSTAQTLTFQTVFGNNNTFAGAVTLGTNYMAVSTAFRWHVTCRVICLTTGAGGTWTSELHGQCSVNNANLLTSGSSSANATSGFTACESSGSVTLDTTIAQGLKIQAAWGATTGAPTITKRAAIQRKLGIG